jgi:hypothetical protein
VTNPAAERLLFKTFVDELAHELGLRLAEHSSTRGKGTILLFIEPYGERLIHAVIVTQT